MYYSMDTPWLITYDNKPTEATEFFKNTLHTRGWHYTLIGVGDAWQGWITRMQAYSAFLQTLPEDRLVVLSDARDVICLRGPKAFTKAFASFGKDMVASMELVCCGQFETKEDFKCVQCQPLTQYWAYYSRVPPMRKYVNNGLLAGRVRALKLYFAWILEKGFTDDQFALGTYVNTFPDRVALDTEALVLHTTNFGVNAGIQSIHLQKQDSPTFAEIFGRGAFFLHIPGCINKGQAIIYEFVKQILAHGACDARLSAPYKYSEPEWDEIF